MSFHVEIYDDYLPGYGKLEVGWTNPPITLDIRLEARFEDYDMLDRLPELSLSKMDAVTHFIRILERVQQENHSALIKIQTVAKEAIEHADSQGWERFALARDQFTRLWHQLAEAGTVFPMGLDWDLRDGCGPEPTQLSEYSKQAEGDRELVSGLFDVVLNFRKKFSDYKAEIDEERMCERFFMATFTKSEPVASRHPVYRGYETLEFDISKHRKARGERAVLYDQVAYKPTDLPDKWPSGRKLEKVAKDWLARRNRIYSPEEMEAESYLANAVATCRSLQTA